MAATACMSAHTATTPLVFLFLCICVHISYSLLVVWALFVTIYFMVQGLKFIEHSRQLNYDKHSHILLGLVHKTKTLTSMKNLRVPHGNLMFRDSLIMRKMLNCTLGMGP
jgi:hypothetical protein